MLEMIDWKSILGFTAVALTFVGYAPYLRDIVRKKTHPHLYSWVLWGFVTLLAFALQISGGAGVGALVTLTAALLCFVVIFLSFRSGAKRDIKPIDTVFFVLAIVAVFIWLFAEQPDDRLFFRPHRSQRHRAGQAAAVFDDPARDFAPRP